MADFLAQLEVSLARLDPFTHLQSFNIFCLLFRRRSTHYPHQLHHINRHPRLQKMPTRRLLVRSKQLLVTPSPPTKLTFGTLVLIMYLGRKKEHRVAPQGIFFKDCVLLCCGRYKHLTAEQTKQLFRAFKRNTNTTRVDLSGNNLEEGWRYIVKFAGAKRQTLKCLLYDH
jgi:hypothetical protein